MGAVAEVRVSFRRIAGAAGVVLVLLVIASNMARAGPPAANSPALNVASYYLENAGLLKVGLALSAVSNIFVLPFYAGLFAMVRDGEHERNDAWSIAGLLAAGLATGAVIIADAAEGALLLRADELTGQGWQPGLVLPLWDLSTFSFTTGRLFGALAVAAFSIGGMRGRVIPLWLGFLGI